MNHRTVFAAFGAAIALGVTAPANAQYNHSAGRSAPLAVVPVARNDGTVEWHETSQRPTADTYGNARGNQYDLAVDGAFTGQTVAVLHFYTGEGFDFALPRAALQEKGFSVYRWSNAPPAPAVLREGLAHSTQLWVISGAQPLLTDEHIRVIRDFFDAGHGVYILGDNSPYYADANALGRALLDSTMDGDVPGAQTVGLRTGAGHVGLLQDHLITTGLEHLYEGITIATIRPNPSLTPLLYGSAGNLVSAVYDHDGRRAIIDGGFTRMYINWDTAGTARYVKNAAAWLANVERFGSPTHPATRPASQGATSSDSTASRSAPRVATMGAPTRHSMLEALGGLALLAIAVAYSWRSRV